MGIIILPLFIFALFLAIVMMYKTMKYIIISKNYTILLRGLLFSLIEIIFLLTNWKLEGKIYAFTPIFSFLIYFIIIPSIVSLILDFPSGESPKRLSRLLSANVTVLFILLVFHYFISQHIFSLFDLLEIKVHY